MDKLMAARVFIDVAHSLSFTATAERLDMSRPMVTRYIESMESWLKCCYTNSSDNQAAELLCASAALNRITYLKMTNS